MATQPLTILAAMQGSYIINDTTAWTGKCDAVYVLEAAVFSILNDTSTGTKNTYISNPAVSVPAGALIRPIKDEQFDKIILTSGKVALVL